MMTKVSLMRNSWHTRLHEYVLGSHVNESIRFNAYFWTILFCAAASPFVLIWKRGPWVVRLVVYLVNRRKNDD